MEYVINETGCLQTKIIIHLFLNFGTHQKRTKYLIILKFNNKTNRG